jgi:ribosomal protein S18 acetylase RimI-like enzyme
VMSSSLDESDRYAIAHAGPEGAVLELLQWLPEYFVRPPGWWLAGIDAQGRAVGFVLPVLFKAESDCKGGRPQGTIFYMGVLPGFRGRGYARELLDQATRIFIQAACWRIFCDTSSANAPMLDAFRAAGYMERARWQRPLAPSA